MQIPPIPPSSSPLFSSTPNDDKNDVWKAANQLVNDLQAIADRVQYDQDNNIDPTTDPMLALDLTNLTQDQGVLKNTVDSVGPPPLGDGTLSQDDHDHIMQIIDNQMQGTINQVIQFVHNLPANDPNTGKTNITTDMIKKLREYQNDFGGFNPEGYVYQILDVLDPHSH